MYGRIDQVEKYYKPIELCNRFTALLFWLCAALSLVVPYSAPTGLEWLTQVINVAFVVLVVAYAVIAHFTSLVLITRAEQARRKQLVSDSFGLPLIPEKTQGYYNNPLEPSIDRLGACVLENAFFGKHVCSEMAKRERIRVFVYGLLWLAAITCRTTDLGLVLALTQVLFSGEVLAHWAKLEFLRARIERVFDQLYGHFLNHNTAESGAGVACILESFASYEAAKAAASIKQSSKVFHRLNPTLSSEWEEIRAGLKIVAECATEDVQVQPAESTGS